MAATKFLHTSDWQLGMTRHFLSEEAQSRYSAARIDVIRSIARLAQDERVDFVVVAGDVFDSNLLSAQTVRRSLEALRSFTVPVFLLPGNHDALDAATIYRSSLFTDGCPDLVRPLLGPGIVPVSQGVELVAAPLFSRAPLLDLVGDAVRDLSADGTLRVVVGHGQAESIVPIDGNPAALRLAPMEAALASGAVHYVALGDRHSRTSVGESGRIHYSGSPEVTDFRDSAAGDVLIVELDGSGAFSVTPHRVGTWSFLDIARNLNGPEDLDEFAAALDGITDKARTVVRTALVGTLSLADQVRLGEITDAHRDLLAALFAWDRHTDLAVVVDPQELTDLGVGGFIDEGVADLAALAAQDGPQAETARDALCLLYRLAGGGSR